MLLGAHHINIVNKNIFAQPMWGTMDASEEIDEREEELGVMCGWRAVERG
jgi:hypothetical protein